MSNEQKPFDMTKPFSIMIFDKDGEFGIVCGPNGALDCAESEAQHKLNRKNLMEEYQMRGGTWINSAAMFAMQFQFNAITIESANWLQEQIGVGPYTMKGISCVAGNGHIMCVPREPFEELLKNATDISFG